MQTYRTCLGLFAGLVLGSATGAAAEQWFTIAAASEAAESAIVEIDLETLRAQGNSGEGVIRVTHDVAQPHPAGFGFRSFVATAQFDCVRRTITLVSAAYYPLPAGHGPPLSAESAGQQAAMPPKLVESIPASARQALIRATCATAQTN